MVACCEMTADKVISQGKGPLARYKHTAAIFNNYFIVFGGRNDKMYCDDMKTVGLNDIHLLDLKTSNWVTVAMFGEILPQSRWGCSLVSSNNKLLLFGGMNLEKICSASIYEVNIDDNEVSTYLH